MKKLSLLIFFLVISCAPVQTEKKINFSKDLTFEEFKSNLKASFSVFSFLIKKYFINIPFPTDVFEHREIINLILEKKKGF